MTDYTSIEDARPDANVLASYGEVVEIQDNSDESGVSVCIVTKPRGQYRRRESSSTKYWGDVEYTRAVDVTPVLWNSRDVARYIKREGLAPKPGGSVRDTITEDVKLKQRLALRNRKQGSTD